MVLRRQHRRDIADGGRGDRQSDAIASITDNGICSVSDDSANTSSRGTGLQDRRDAR